MIVNDVMNAIKAAEAKTGIKFSAFDLGKWIDVCNDGCVVEFDVIHKNELSSGYIAKLYSLAQEIKAELLSWPETLKKTLGLGLPGIDGHELEKAYIDYCLTQRPKRYSIDEEHEMYSIFVEE